MRFSLGQLLMVFPAFFLAMLISNGLLSSTRGHPRCFWEKNTLRQLRIAILSYDADCTDGPAPVQVLNRWLAGEEIPPEFAEDLPDIRNITDYKIWDYRTT